MKYLVVFILLRFIIISNCVLQAQWIPTSRLNGVSVFCMVLNDVNLFAGTEGGGVYLSTNNGTDWTQVNNGLTGFLTIKALAVCGTDIFAGMEVGGVFRSTNNGTTWIQAGLTGIAVYSFAVIGTNIYAGTSDSERINGNTSKTCLNPGRT